MVLLGLAIAICFFLHCGISLILAIFVVLMIDLRPKHFKHSIVLLSFWCSMVVSFDFLVWARSMLTSSFTDLFHFKFGLNEICVMLVVVHVWLITQRTIPLQQSFLPIVFDGLAVATFLFCLFPIYVIKWLLVMLYFSLCIATVRAPTKLKRN